MSNQSVLREELQMVVVEMNEKPQSPEVPSNEPDDEYVRLDPVSITTIVLTVISAIQRICTQEPEPLQQMAGTIFGKARLRRETWKALLEEEGNVQEFAERMNLKNGKARKMLKERRDRLTDLMLKRCVSMNAQRLGEVIAAVA